MVRATYVFAGPVIVEHPVDVQYSDTVPYMRFTWSKNEIAGSTKKDGTCSSLQNVE